MFLDCHSPNGLRNGGIRAIPQNLATTNNPFGLPRFCFAESRNDDSFILMDSYELQSDSRNDENGAIPLPLTVFARERSNRSNPFLKAAELQMILMVL